jgi:hypothetical protein
MARGFILDPTTKKSILKKKASTKRSSTPAPPRSRPARNIKSNGSSDSRTGQFLPKNTTRVTVPKKFTQRRLGLCGANYFHALYDPFSVQGEVCVPDMMAVPSMKFRVISRGTFVVGTAGCGGVAYWPYRMCTSDIYVNGLNYFPATVATNAAYAQPPTNLDITNFYSPLVTVGQNFGAGLTSPFNVNFLGAGTDGTVARKNVRLVAAGIRASYDGKEVDRAGQYICWQNPILKGGVSATVDDLDSYLAINQAARLRVMDDGTAGFTYLPRSELDLQYPTIGLNYAGDGVVNGTPINRLAGAIFVIGATVGTTFSFEAVAHFEAIGANLSTTSTNGDPDAIGTALGASGNDQLQTNQSMALAVAASRAMEIARKDGRPLDLGNLLGPLAQKGAQVQKILRSL